MPLSVLTKQKLKNNNKNKSKCRNTANVCTNVFMELSKN